MGSEAQIAAAQQHGDQKTEWERDQIGRDHQRDFRRAMQGDHSGANSTDKRVIWLDHDSETRRELANANIRWKNSDRQFKLLFRFRVSVSKSELSSEMESVSVNKLIISTLMKYGFDHAQPEKRNSSQLACK